MTEATTTATKSKTPNHVASPFGWPNFEVPNFGSPTMQVPEAFREIAEKASHMPRIIVRKRRPRKPRNSRSSLRKSRLTRPLEGGVMATPRHSTRSPDLESRTRPSQTAIISQFAKAKAATSEN